MEYIFHPKCCNCQLAEGENPHPANYRGCRYTKKEMQKKKSQRTPRTTKGRVFSSNLTTPGKSFAAALRGKQRNSSSLGHIRWQVPTQWNSGPLRLYPNTNSRKQVSQ
jgi:hypothetical protein